ncbi:SRPBCC family protein [Bdellovibrio sp. GT3]|uniref:SRPBCC family protein n=1 Tax=Bdellovibrio sp. GT3 TaxID=3136282 RepID=UPI0030F0B375
MKINPKLDLVLERTLDITPEESWKGWTTPELLCKWFCPEPWKVTEAEVDLRPGGIFKTVMQSPEGEKFPNAGCFLEVIPNKKLTWTDCLLPDFRPVENIVSGADLHFTATIMMEAAGGGKTKYTAIAMHRDETDRKKHEDMGFHQGWGICADQLEKLMKSLR